MKNVLQNSVAATAGILTGAISAVAGLGNTLGGSIGVTVVALGAGVIMFVGVRVLMSAVTPAPALLVPTSANINEQTSALLERVLQQTSENREKLDSWMTRTGEAGRTYDVVMQARGLTTRIETLAQSDVIQGRDPYDGTLAMLDGIATRYLPELMENLDDTIDFINKFSGQAQQDALANLSAVSEQLGSLGEALEKVERDIVKGTTHSLDVHAEFLRQRLAQGSTSPIIDA